MGEPILTAASLTKKEATALTKDMIGQPAPAFELSADDGSVFDSTSLNGTWRLIFFYSRDNSPTCKRGCLTFKEQYDLFVSAGCSVVGVGRDSVDSHRTFKEGFTGGLPFPILSDPDRLVATSFNVPMHLGRFPAKSSFLIGPDDTVHYVYDWLFRPRRHVARILGDLTRVTGGEA